MDFSQIAKSRHSCKAFDPARQLSAAQLQQLQDLLHWAPSSINLQPWHFYLASSSAGKAQIAHAMASDAYAYNASKVRDAAPFPHRVLPYFLLAPQLAVTVLFFAKPRQTVAWEERM